MPAAQSPVTVAPGIDTERLTLRGHRIDDFDECAAMWAEPEVIRYIGGKPLSREAVWSQLLRCAGHWSLMGFGYWVMREKTSGRFVGEVGFADLERDIEPSLEGSPELGYVLASWAHGQGLATEAVRAVLAWGAERFGARRTVCVIDPRNAGSIRVATKCGYREVASTTYKGEPILVFER